MIVTAGVSVKGGLGGRAVGPVVLSLLLFIAACSSGDSAVQARLIPPIAGTVQVNSSPAHQGDPLRIGDTIIAKGEDAAASIKFEDGTVLHLYGLGAPGGEAKLVVVSYDTSTKALAARLLGGLLTLVSPPKDPPPKKTIQALNTVTATEGTEVKVFSSPTGDTVSLKSGKVTVVAKDGSSVSLAAGQQVQASSGKPIEKAAPYDASKTSEQKLFNPGEDVDKHF